MKSTLLNPVMRVSTFGVRRPASKKGEGQFLGAPKGAPKGSESFQNGDVFDPFGYSRPRK